ncbi:MAG: hypothetical protein QOK19_659, partial [Solirubrobacteraceae bacterium]|nr:hypothetical protein [Solirubrobacteraceae bacterium]
MLATAQDLSTRNVIKRLLRPVLPALVGLLVFSTAAQADPGAEGPVEGPPATVEGTPEGPGAATGGETTTPAETPAETPPAEAPPPTVETPPPPVETTSPAETTPVEPGPTGETVLTTESPAPEKASEPPVREEHERTAESSLLPAALGGSTGGGAQAEPLSTAPDPLAPTGSEVVTLGAQTGSSGEAPAPLAQGRALVERRAELRLCALSVLGGPSAASCAGGWMSHPGSLASAPLGLG